jgi:hypothetical protein
VEWWYQFSNQWNRVAMMHMAKGISVTHFRCGWRLGVWSPLRAVHAAVVRMDTVLGRDPCPKLELMSTPNCVSMQRWLLWRTTQ